jgi:Holliday junction DNA helicase RuvB
VWLPAEVVLRDSVAVAATAATVSASSPPPPVPVSSEGPNHDPLQTVPLTAPLRARFGINARLSYYDSKTLTDIVERSSAILKIPITPDAAYEIARRSRGTPRIANALLRRVRDFAQIKGDGTIEINITQMSLDALNVDTLGLDEMDNKILMTMMNKFNGGPVGLTTIATAVGEDAGTIEEVYEPFLIQEGFLTRTPRGRQLTDLTYKHLGKIRNNPGQLF